MKKVLIYDLPTRLFHWVFAGLFIVSFLIGKNVDDESSIYSYHMMLGLTLAVAVVLRVVWGFVGSRYARFNSFALNPSQAIEYFKSLLTSLTKLYTGHNPASSWAALVMMTWGVALAITGYLMTNAGMKKSLEDVHEFFANTFLLVVIAHIAGVIFHTIRHRDPIALSMITGKKQTEDATVVPSASHALVGILFVLMIGAFGGSLFANYDPQARSTRVFGQTLQLGESEEDEKVQGLSPAAASDEDKVSEDEKPTIDED